MAYFYSKLEFLVLHLVGISYLLLGVCDTWSSRSVWQSGEYHYVLGVRILYSRREIFEGEIFSRSPLWGKFFTRS